MPTGTDLVLYDPDRVAREERFVRRNFWRKLRANLHRIPFLEELLAAYFCATDSATPFKVKAILLGALAYFVLPVDALPDWLLVAGFTDDAAVLAAAIQAVRTNLTPDHWLRARNALRAETAGLESAGLDSVRPESAGPHASGPGSNGSGSNGPFSSPSPAGASGASRPTD